MPHNTTNLSRDVVSSILLQEVDESDLDSFQSIDAHTCPPYYHFKRLSIPWLTQPARYEVRHVPGFRAIQRFLIMMMKVMMMATTPTAHAQVRPFSHHH